jgi:isopentenyl-diphosphate delta-isomerase
MLAEERRNQVVLLDPQGQVIGYEDKLKAHQEGSLHQAFSIVLVNDSDQMLIQQRGLEKYHFAGLWSNACCSHPMPEEAIADAAHRRLKEELGVDTPLKEAFRFMYKVKDVKTALYEHEYDIVFVGIYQGDLFPNKEEIHALKWISIEDLQIQVVRSADLYSEWFKIILQMLEQKNLLSSQTISKYLLRP